MPSSYRESYGHFRRYAEYIGLALTAWPDPIEVRLTSGGQPSGFLQPCRDAITAKQLHHYVSPHVDERLFALYGAKLSVYERAGRIYLGPQLSKETGTKALAVPNSTTVHSLVDNTLIHALCQLASKQALRPFPFVTIAGIPEPELASLSKQYDILFEPLPDGTYQII